MDSLRALKLEVKELITFYQGHYSLMEGSAEKGEARQFQEVEKAVMTELIYKRTEKRKSPWVFKGTLIGRILIWGNLGYTC